MIIQAPACCCSRRPQDRLGLFSRELESRRLMTRLP